MRGLSVKVPRHGATLTRAAGVSGIGFVTGAAGVLHRPAPDAKWGDSASGSDHADNVVCGIREAVADCA